MNRLYLVRHGENVANLTKEFSSRRVDYSLTEKGVLQAQQTARYLAGQDIHEIYSSPLKRARETAEIIGEQLGLPVTVVDEFREIDVGDLELQPPTAEAWAFHNEVLVGWVTGHPERTFPGGDNYYTLTARMRAGLERITAGKDGRNLLVVAHGGIFVMSLPDLVPGIDLKWLLRTGSHNCSISQIVVDGGDGGLRGELVDWASCVHLSGEAANLVSGLPE
jgi:broad specificity phosphatase PhoE